MSDLKPEAKGTPIDLRYDPQGSGMSHDAKFAALCPGVANSGNLAHQWTVKGDHSSSEKPPENLRGE